MNLNPINSRKRTEGFTLVELLVVISIIGILAGMVVGLAGVAGKKRKITRAKGDLARIQTAIADYETTYGQRPPGNPETDIYTKNNLFTSLYYELSGMRYDSGTEAYTTLDKQHTLTVTGASGDPGRDIGVSGIPGFVNAEEKAESFLNTRAKGYALVERDVGEVPFRLLIVEGETPNTSPKITGIVDGVVKEVNPWRYDEVTPEFNRQSYDLWVEIVVGEVKDPSSPANAPTFKQKVETISNW
ncbi:type II secretion system GspH family protein [Verrucomicrobia bacterium]|nr:type II secretion system GspH family protein [Verrucomicrobiota bacterium]